MTRILHLGVLPSRPGVGPSRLARTLVADRLKQHDMHVGLLVSGVSESEAADAIGGADLGDRLTLIPRRGRFDPIAAGRVRGLVRRCDPDIVHVWSTGIGGVSCVAALLGVRATVLWEQDDVIPGGDWGTGRVRRSAARVVVDNEAAVGFCVKSGIDAEKIRVIRPAIEASLPGDGTDDGDPKALARSAMLQRLGLPADIRLLGLAAPLDRRERLKDAVWATDLLKVIRDDCHLLIVGDGPYFRRLRMFRDQVRIRDKVHLLTSAEFDPSWTAGYDAWMQTAENGTAPTAALQAMAHGVPVVISDIGPNAEVIRDGENGFLFDVGDRATLTRRVLRLLDDRELARTIGQAGRRFVTAGFTTDAMLDAYENLYDEIEA